MDVYRIIYLILVVEALITGCRTTHIEKKVIYWTGAILLITVTAFRSSTVGEDTQNYCIAFREIQDLSWREMLMCGWEQGYVLFNRALALVTKNERFFLVTMAVLILTPLFSWICQDSLWPGLSLVIFVGMGLWYQSMFVMRQWCAMAILSFSCKFIREHDFIRFAMCVLIATMFHRTAAIFILVWFLVYIPLNSLSILISVAVSILMGLCGKYIVLFLNNYAKASDMRNLGGGYSLLFVLWACIITTFLAFKGKIPQKISLEYKAVWFAAVIQPISFCFSGWARIVQYFSIFLVTLLPNTIVLYTGKNNKKWKIILGIILCGAMLIWYSAIQKIPYSFMKV